MLLTRNIAIYSYEFDYNCYLIKEKHEIDQEGNDEGEELDLEEVPGEEAGELGHVLLHVE